MRKITIIDNGQQGVQLVAEPNTISTSDILGSLRVATVLVEKGINAAVAEPTVVPASKGDLDILNKANGSR